MDNYILLQYITFITQVICFNIYIFIYNISLLNLQLFKPECKLCTCHCKVPVIDLVNFKYFLFIVIIVILCRKNQ